MVFLCLCFYEEGLGDFFDLQWNKSEQKELEETRKKTGFRISDITSKGISSSILMFLRRLVGNAMSPENLVGMAVLSK